jgi:hypothetical protein
MKGNDIIRNIEAARRKDKYQKKNPYNYEFSQLYVMTETKNKT